MRHKAALYVRFNGLAIRFPSTFFLKLGRAARAASRTKGVNGRAGDFRDRPILVSLRRGMSTRAAGGNGSTWYSHRPTQRSNIVVGRRVRCSKGDPRTRVKGSIRRNVRGRTQYNLNHASVEHGFRSTMKFAPRRSRQDSVIRYVAASHMLVCPPRESTKDPAIVRSRQPEPYISRMGRRPRRGSYQGPMTNATRIYPRLQVESIQDTRRGSGNCRTSDRGRITMGELRPICSNTFDFDLSLSSQHS